MNIFNFLGRVLQFIDFFLVPLIFAIAFIVFLWGIFTYFIAGGANDEKQKEGKQLALWGIIGFVIMVAVWGIVNLLINSLGFDNKTRPPLPTFGNSAQQQTTNGTLFQGSNTTTGSATGGGLPLGAVCSSHRDAECTSGECDWINAPATPANWRCIPQQSAQQSSNSTSGSTGGQGQPCSTGGTCSSGLSCENGTCQASTGASTSAGGSLGDQCSPSLPCAAPYQCPTNGNTCVLGVE